MYDGLRLRMPLPMPSPTWIRVILCSRSSCLWSKVFILCSERILDNVFVVSYLSYRNWHSSSTFSPCIACLACSENLPEKLATVAWDRAPSRFPVQYQRNAIASTLASRLVYAEGIHMVESQPVDRVAQRAFEYYRESRVVNKIADDLVSWVPLLGIVSLVLILIDLCWCFPFQAAAEVRGLDGAEKSKAVDLIRRGGARTSLGIF